MIKEFPRTRQEMFDIAAVHLLKQEQRCVNDEGKCLYRKDKTPDSIERCAIGACIPDDKYNSNMENIVARYLIQQYFPESKDLMFFADQIQDIHDYKPRWDNRKSVLKDLARNYGLTLPPEFGTS